MSLKEFANKELTLAEILGPDGAYDGFVGESVEELIDVFSKQGHSGGSASLTLHLFNKLANFEHITPLTGDDDEWMKVGSGVYQNTRCPYIFKDVNLFDGQAYNINGKVFREPNGCCYTSVESLVPVEFPYVYAVEYVDVEEGIKE